MYNWRVRAVQDALEKRGKSEGPLDVSDLYSLGHLDQYHYLGTEACDDVAEILGLEAGRTVLDVGSGIGGPARYLAATTGCNVVGLELQGDLCQAATTLTARVPGLDARVQFVNGDASQMSVYDGALARPFDHFISLLVNLHVPDRRALHAALQTQLAPGGTFVIEDFAALAPPTAAETHTLVDMVKAPSVTTIPEYVAELEAVGFVDVQTIDMSAVWAEWTEARSAEYVASEADAVALHGRATFESRASFYAAVAALFAGGRVGGVRITGRAPGKLEAALRTGIAKQANKSTRTAAVRILESGAAFTSGA